MSTNKLYSALLHSSPLESFEREIPVSSEREMADSSEREILNSSEREIVNSSERWSERQKNGWSKFDPFFQTRMALLEIPKSINVTHNVFRHKLINSGFFRHFRHLHTESDILLLRDRAVHDAMSPKSVC